MARRTEDSAIATARYRALIDQLREELGERYGWQSEAARRLDISRSQLSKLLAKPDLPVGRESVLRAMISLRLPEAFFYDEDADASNYRLLQANPLPPARVDAAGEVDAVDAFLDSWINLSKPANDLFLASMAGRRVRPDELRALARGVLGTRVVEIARELDAGRDVSAADAGLFSLLVALMSQAAMMVREFRAAEQRRDGADGA